MIIRLCVHDARLLVCESVYCLNCVYVYMCWRFQYIHLNRSTTASKSYTNDMAVESICCNECEQCVGCQNWVASTDIYGMVWWRRPNLFTIMYLYVVCVHVLRGIFRIHFLHIKNAHAKHKTFRHIQTVKCAPAIIIFVQNSLNHESAVTQYVSVYYVLVLETKIWMKQCFLSATASLTIFHRFILLHLFGCWFFFFFCFNIVDICHFFFVCLIFFNK